MLIILPCGPVVICNAVLVITSLDVGVYVQKFLVLSTRSYCHNKLCGEYKCKQTKRKKTINLSPGQNIAT